MTAALALVGVCAVTGCSHGPTGTVSGSLVERAPNGAGGQADLSGKVVAVRAGGGKTFTASVGLTGAYTLSLPPGDYHLTGRSPALLTNGSPASCADPDLVHVTTGGTVSGADVVCVPS